MNDANRKVNFNAGPAELPATVLQQASQAIIEYENSGLSILGIEHRGKHFNAILEESMQLVKELCEIGDDYQVLWLHGGGRLQFCMIPMNFLRETGKAGYIDSGFWASEAASYARYYGKTDVLSSSRETNYTALPEWPGIIPHDLSYVHFTTNNTIYGTQWDKIPYCQTPLIADMSSDVFSRRRDYKNCSVFYAVAQKNIGAAGVTLVAIRKDMLTRQQRILPPMLSYAEHVAKNSVLNTPPVFSIYTCLLTLRWIKARGIDTIERDNREKAEILYREIDRNSAFRGVAAVADRSMMNVCFRTKNDAFQQNFIQFCSDRDLTGIEGHRNVGGLRVSLYNATTVADVQRLINAMKEFEIEYGA